VRVEWKDGKEAWRGRFGKEDQERGWRERDRDRECEERSRQSVDRERWGKWKGRMYIGGGVEREVCEKGW
jgi:hypothetical protein